MAEAPTQRMHRSELPLKNLPERVKKTVKTPAPNRIVHIDTETTGLHPHEGLLLEIAVVITDDDLHPVAEYTSLIEHDLRQVRDALDPFTRSMHEANALLEDLEAFQSSGKHLAWVEEEVISFLGAHGADRAVAAGSSIGFDRGWLDVHMPTLNRDHLHYRNVDVSTIKELARRWAPDVFAAAPEKQLGHRALADIHETIRELAHYREAGFLHG